MIRPIKEQHGFDWSNVIRWLLVTSTFFIAILLFIHLPKWMNEYASAGWAFAFLATSLFVVFNNFDVNGDGKVNQEDLKELFEELLMLNKTDNDKSTDQSTDESFWIDEMSEKENATVKVVGKNSFVCIDKKILLTEPQLRKFAQRVLSVDETGVFQNNPVTRDSLVTAGWKKGNTYTNSYKEETLYALWCKEWERAGRLKGDRLTQTGINFLANYLPYSANFSQNLQYGDDEDGQ